MNFTIRALTTRDIPDLLTMLRSFGTQSEQPCTATEDALYSGMFGTVPKAYALLAYDTSTATPRAVGFAMWRYSFDALSGKAGIYLHDLFLDASHRGRGIALAFFRALARRAVDEGCSQVQWSTLVRNAPAISLYQSLSAIPISAWTAQKLTGETLRTLAD